MRDRVHQMKKFILPSLIVVPIFFWVIFITLFFLLPTANAQANDDCQSIFDKELYKCLVESSSCINSCVDKANKAASLSVDGGKVNLECQKNTCDPAKEACDQQVQANYRACLKEEENTSVDAVLKEPSNTKSQEECYRAYQDTEYQCVQTRTSCMWDCPDLDNQKKCSEECETEDRTCSEVASDDLKACLDANSNSSADAVSKPQSPQESPTGVVSSKNLKSLLRAMNEFQAAQAELEKVKAANDPAWEAKNNFANSYQAALKDVPSETELQLKVMRADLEYIKDAAGVPGDIEDLGNYLQGKGLGPSSRAGKVAEVGEGVIEFIDLMNEGESFENAATKATIDTVAPSLFYIFPPLKAADLVATLPDDIMGAVGVPKDHWSRTTTGFLADNSPSAFVELTTTVMVETDTWTNVGGAFQVAWQDLKEAEGVGEKAKATLDLVGTAVGAVPVAIALRTRDQVLAAVELFKMGASGAGQLVSGWFTSPD